MSCQTLNSGSNDLKEDRVLSNQSDRLSNSDDSNSENEDEIFLVFRGKPNSRQSTFDEGQAAAGKETDMIEWSSHMIILYQSIRSLKLYPSSPTGTPPKHFNFWQLVHSSSCPWCHALCKCRIWWSTFFWEGKAGNYNFLVDLSNFNFNFSILFQFDFSFGVYACDSELHINR